MLRTILLKSKNICTTNTLRHLSATSDLVKVQVDKQGIAILTMNRQPVNGLNLELLTAIKNSIDEIEKNRCRGLILTSSLKTIFSAGLDITEMYQPEATRLSSFWTALQDAWLALYGSNVPTAALINGHAPAGGCLLATSCEYRVMLPKYTIGLNETKLGIVAPRWFMATYLNVLPRRIAESALIEGKMFNTDEALQIGLVDAVADDSAAALQKCLEFFGTFAKVNPVARARTKLQFRAADLVQLEKERQQDLNIFLQFVNQPSVQKGLGLYMESLKKSK